MEDKKVSVMDQLEALKTITTGESTNDSDKEKGRKAAASKWVSHYLAVVEAKEHFLKSGGKPEEFTKEVAEKLLIAGWDDKSKQAI